MPWVSGISDSGKLLSFSFSNRVVLPVPPSPTMMSLASYKSTVPDISLSRYSSKEESITSLVKSSTLKDGLSSKNVLFFIVYFNK